MKTAKSIIVVLFVLLTAQIASAYYCPSTGRWLSRDPIGEPGFQALQAATAPPRVGGVISMPQAHWIKRDSIAAKNDPNRYAFVHNEPIDLVDREGLSWWRNLLCPCKCQSVQVTGKPVAPPGVGWYIPGPEYAQYGNLMTVTWTVTGNSKSCSYGQNETGFSTADSIPRDPNKQKTSPIGSDHPDVSSIVPITYGSGSATYQDYMGIIFRAPADNGDWDYFLDLHIDFTCTSSDGTRMTGQHLNYTGAGKLHF